MLLFQAHDTASISDRSSVELTSEDALILDLNYKSPYVLKYGIHNSLILASASINYRSFSYLQKCFVLYKNA